MKFTRFIFDEYHKFPFTFFEHLKKTHKTLGYGNDLAYF